MMGLALLSLSTFVVCLSATCTNVIAFDLKLDLDSLLGNDFQWTFPAFVCGECAAMGFCAGFLDRYGRRTPFMLGTALFLLGCILCATSENMPFFCIARFVQGVGAGAVIVTGVAQIYYNIRIPHKRYLGNGLLSLGFGAGMVFGIFIGRAAIDYGFGWRSLMWMFLILQALLAYPCAKALENGRNSEMRPDVAGGVILALLLGFLVYYLEKIYLDWRMESVGAKAGLALLILLCVAFAYAEVRNPESVARRALDDSRLMVASLVMIVLLGMIDMGAVGWMAKVALFTYHLSVLEVLGPFTVLILGAVCTAVPASKTIHRTGHTFWFVLSAILSPVALLSISFIRYGDAVIFLSLHMFLIGLAIGCLVSLINGTIQNRVTVDNNGAYMSFAIATRTAALWVGYNVYQAFTDAHMVSQMGPTMDFWNSVLGVGLPCNGMLPCILVTPLADVLKVIPGLTARIADVFAEGVANGCAVLGILFAVVAIPVSVILVGRRKTL